MWRPAGGYYPPLCRHRSYMDAARRVVAPYGISLFAGAAKGRPYGASPLMEGPMPSSGRGGHRGRAPYTKNGWREGIKSRPPLVSIPPHGIYIRGLLGVVSHRAQPCGSPFDFISSGEMNSPCGNSLPLSGIEFTACRPPRLRGGTTPDHLLHVPHLYPYPHTVFTYTGFWGLSSILMRRRRMFTSTIFSSP